MKRVIAILMAAFMLVGYLPFVSADGTSEEGFTVIVMKDNEPFMEELEIDVLDGENIVDTLYLKMSSVKISKYESGKTYTLRVKSNQYDVLTKYMKVAYNDFFSADVPHFLENLEETLDPEKTALIKLKDRDQESTGTEAEEDGEYIDIPDKLFLKVINKNLDPARPDDQRITKSEMESLTMISHYLDANGKPGIRDNANQSILGTPRSLEDTEDFKFMVSYGIKSIEGIQYAKNLTHLKLNENEISDISPLRGLTKLEYLEFSRNRVVDIEPIKNLKNLTFLKLYNNWIEDVRPIAGLTKLTDLDLHYNVRQQKVDGRIVSTAGITDISPLKTLTNLNYFDISANRVSDASVILNFPEMRDLDLSSNQIETYEGLGEYIAKIYAKVQMEVGSQNFWAQKVSLEQPVLVDEKNVEFENGYKGFKELFTSLVKATSEEKLSEEELLQDALEYTQVESDNDDIQASYDLDSNTIKLKVSDTFLEENKGKNVKLNLKFTFAYAYSWDLGLTLKVMGGEDIPPTTGLKELPVKVEYKGQPKADFELAAHKKEGNFYSMVIQQKTNKQGIIILKNLDPNSEYVIRSREVKVYFEEESFVILTNEKGEIKSINGKSVTKYPEGIIFKMVDKEDSSIKKVRVEFKTVDRNTGEAVKGVVLTANTINPNLGSYKDEISDDNGVVKFDLIGAENGKNYSITVSKNGQFLWDFEPAEIEVVVKKGGYEILSTKGNENKGNVLKVTANDRRHLKVDLAKLIQKAEEIIASDEYKKDYKKELSRAVLGGKMELEKAETLPYYVEGHISNIESLMKKIVLKEKPLSETESSNSSNNVDTYTEYTGIVEKREEVKDEKKEEIKADKAENKVEEPEVEIVINPPTIPFGMIDIAVTPAQDAIKNTVERGILKGVAANRFEPKLPVSRAMVTEVLMRLAADKSVNDSIVFSDVNKDSWYAKSVKWAASHNIIKGYKDGTFRADKKVSLQEFAYMLKGYGKKMPKTVSVDRSMYSYLPEWSREAVIGLVEVGLIEVNQKGKYRFDGEINREYLAVIVDKLIRFTEENKAK